MVEKKRTLFPCVDLCNLFDSAEKDRGEKWLVNFFPIYMLPIAYEFHPKSRIFRLE